jgi:rhodanese-related sulfurtransferase
LVTVTPINLSDKEAATIDFEIVMDTHAGDLGFEMTKIATLKGNTEEEASPTAWSGGKGGHHLSGKLTFPTGALRATGRVTLTLKGVGGGNDLVFEWETLSAAAREDRRVAVEGGFYTNISPSQLDRMLNEKDFFLVNTHVPYEGEIGSTDAFIPYNQTKAKIKAYPAAKNAEIVLYCRSGRMSDIAARILVEEGFTDVINLEGGMIAWEKAGFLLESAGGRK